MKLRFYFFTLLLLFARGCDFYSTSLWIFQPGGLEMETNPLTRFLGFGWNGLVLANLLVVLLVLAAYYYYLFYYQPKRLDKEIDNYREYGSSLYFGQKDRWHWMFYRIPKNKKAYVAHLGYVLIRVLIIASFLATFHNLCQFYNVAFYDTFREWVRRPLYVIYALIGFSVVVYSRQILRQEYELLYPVKKVGE